jgi:hypothetical protein
MSYLKNNYVVHAVFIWFLYVFAEEEYEETQNCVEKKGFDNEAGLQIKNYLEEREKAKNKVISKED